MPTRQFEEYAEFLAVTRSDEEWSGLALESAAARLARFSPADWEALRAQWGFRDPRWQRRCAESLVGGDAAQAVPLLLAMLDVDVITVSEAAVFTLASLPEAGLRAAAAAIDPGASLDALHRRTARPAVIEAAEGFLARWRALRA